MGMFDDNERLLAGDTVNDFHESSKNYNYDHINKLVATNILEKLQRKQLAQKKQEQDQQEQDVARRTAESQTPATDYINSVTNFQDSLPGYIKKARELEKRGIEKKYIWQHLVESGLKGGQPHTVFKGAFPDKSILDESTNEGATIDTSAGPGVESTFRDRGHEGRIPVQEKPTTTAGELINNLLHFATPSNLPLALSGRKVGDAVSAPASKGAYGIANLVSELISGNTLYEGTGKKSKPNMPLPKINLMSGMTGVSGLVPQAADQKERTKRAADFIINKLLRQTSGLPKDTTEQSLYKAVKKTYGANVSKSVYKNRIFTTESGDRVVMGDDGTIHQVR